MAKDLAEKWRLGLTALGAAVVLVGWGVSWANQNARIAANKANIDAMARQMETVVGQAAEADKAIVRIETKLEYIIKGIDEIKAEIKVGK